MLPSVVASELEQVAADAIRTAFHPTTPGFSGLIDRFLAEREQLLKGPYVSGALPFHQGTGRKAKPTRLWHEHAPEELAWDAPLPADAIFYFLLPDPGMAAYGDKVIKSLEPSEYLARTPRVPWGEKKPVTDFYRFAARGMPPPPMSEPLYLPLFILA